MNKIMSSYLLKLKANVERSIIYAKRIKSCSCLSDNRIIYVLKQNLNEYTSIIRDTYHTPLLPDVY